MNQGLFRLRSLGLAAATAGLALAGSCASAQASLIATSACDNSTLVQPFTRWGDTEQYKLVPGGDFESGSAGWTFSRGAQVTNGSEPFGVTGSVGSGSLHLPAGAVAQTPFTCVNAAYPLFRLFARNSGLASSLLVEVVYRTPLLSAITLPVPVGIVALSGSWQPTIPMLTASAVEGALNGGTAQVALRFTAITGDSQIDDVFVDPRMSH